MFNAHKSRGQPKIYFRTHIFLTNVSHQILFTQMEKMGEKFTVGSKNGRVGSSEPDNFFSSPYKHVPAMKQCVMTATCRRLLLASWTTYSTSSTVTTTQQTIPTPPNVRHAFRHTGHVQTQT